MRGAQFCRPCNNLQLTLNEYPKQLNNNQYVICHLIFSQTVDGYNIF